MPKKPEESLKKMPFHRQLVLYLINFNNWCVRRKFWQRFGLTIFILILFLTGSMYAIAQWYIQKNQDKPLVIGATFIPNYARYYELDPKETMTAIIDDLGIKRLRLVSYWSDIEKVQGSYDFSELDWQMQLAADRDVDVSLALGLRQPRWPECHMPEWAKTMSGDSWYQPLNDFIEATVNRYKDNSALESYQLENEFFLKGFGVCNDFNRERLVDEFKLVKSLDHNTPVIVSLSNNAIGVPVGEPTPDAFAQTVYKRVYDESFSGRYFEYPIPAWYYAFRAGFIELTRGKEVFIHELQAEAWTPEPGGTKFASIEEQDKSLNAERLKHRINYGKATGMRTIDLWGAEWWYWRKSKLNDPSLWDTAKQEINKLD